MKDLGEEKAVPMPDESQLLSLQVVRYSTSNSITSDFQIAVCFS